MNRIASHPRFWPVLALCVADGLFFGLTNPSSAPSFMLVAGFLLLAVSLYVALLGVLKIGSWYGLSSVKHRRRLARTTAGVLSGIIALQSIGELSSRDILVLLPLALIAYLYMSYGRARPAVTPEIS